MLRPPLLIAVLALAGAAILAGPADGRAARTLEFESYNGQTLPAGVLAANTFGVLALTLNSTAQDVCIRNWPYFAVSETNVLIGARPGPAGAVCDATQPLLVRTRSNAVKYVGFYIIGKNPNGWTVVAEALDGKVLDSAATDPANNADKSNRWISVADPGGRIARVRVTPAPGSAATAEFGIDNLTWAN